MGANYLRPLSRSENRQAPLKSGNGFRRRTIRHSDPVIARPPDPELSSRVVIKAYIATLRRKIPANRKKTSPETLHPRVVL